MDRASWKVGVVGTAKTAARMDNGSSSVKLRNPMWSFLGE
jgi:hypothetical protein